jgi:LuxR family maltose regulon positive regulatory protein
LAKAWIDIRNLSYAAAEKFIGRAESLFNLQRSSLQAGQRNQILEQIAALKGSLARARGRPREEQLALIQKALKLITKDNVRLRGLLTLQKGLCYLDLGQDQDADLIFLQVIDWLDIGSSFPLYGAVYAHTVVAQLQGRLGEIKVRCVDTIKQTEKTLNTPWQRVAVQGFAYVALGMVELERNHLDRALDYLTRGLSLNTGSGLTELQVKGQYSLGRLSFAFRRPIEPIETSRFQGHALPELARYANALQAHLWLLESNSPAHKQDAFIRAVNWASQQTLQTSQGYDRDWQNKGQLIFIRILLAMRERKDPSFKIPEMSDVLNLLDQELNTFRHRGWVDRVLEILIVKVLTLDGLGRLDEALTVMESALALAEPSGYIRLFLDEAEPILKYLNTASKKATVSGQYARQLLAQYAKTSDQGSLAINQQVDQIEPLTRRELEIIHLIAAGLTNQEIGLELNISLGTVKRHAANIYGKLNTNNRTGAVAAARALKIID